MWSYTSPFPEKTAEEAEEAGEEEEGQGVDYEELSDDE